MDAPSLHLAEGTKTTRESLQLVSQPRLKLGISKKENLSRGAQIFLKSRSHLAILGATWQF